MVKVKVTELLKCIKLHFSGSISSAIFCEELKTVSSDSMDLVYSLSDPDFRISL